MTAGAQFATLTAVPEALVAPERDAELKTAPVAVTAVVAARNEVGYIERCVRSLLSQQVPERDFEVIVADGMSDDGTRDILARLAEDDPRLRVIDNPRMITATAFNAAINASRGRYIAIMGAHARYPDDYLARCLELAERLKVDNVGGATTAEGTTYRQRAIAASHHSAFSVGGASWHSLDYEGPASTVFGGFYRRDVFDRIGMFDERLVRNQDDEFNFRLELAGGSTWQSASVRSWYTPRSTIGALFRQYRQYGYWKAGVMRKHGRAPELRHYVPAAFVLGLALPALLAVVAAFGAIWLPGLQVVSLLFAGLLAAGLALYAVFLGIASFTTARRYGWALLPVLPPIFASYHVGYGTGFLEGFFDFMLRSEARPRASMTELTR